MNMVQNIVTGGTSNTSTPMLKLRMNELFVPIEARHIAHWASVDSAASKRQTVAIEISARYRTIRIWIYFAPSTACGGP